MKFFEQLAGVEVVAAVEETGKSSSSSPNPQHSWPVILVTQWGKEMVFLEIEMEMVMEMEMAFEQYYWLG